MAKTRPVDLRSAILSGEVAQVETSLRNGADVNATIEAITPLVFAIQHGEEDIAVYLIHAGANLSLEPLPNLTEEKDSKENVRLSALDVIIVLLVWFEVSLWDAASALFLASKIWPGSLRPVLNAISAQTLFGFNMRVLIRSVCSALIWRNFSIASLSLENFVLIYVVMFLWTVTDSTPGLEFDSSGSLGWLFQHCFLVCKWRLLTFILIFAQEVLYAWVGLRYLLNPGERANAKSTCYGGSQALEAILSYAGSSHEVVSAIIEMKVLTGDYIKGSIQPAMSSHYPLVLRMWSWAFKNGHTQVVSSLLELGMPATQAYPEEYSPIEWSALHGHLSLCQRLITALDLTDPLTIEQVNEAFLLNIKTDNLHSSMYDQKERLQIQSILLAHVKNVNVRDDKERTALSYAVSGDNISLVSGLLERGADFSLVDIHGRSPLSYITNGENGPSICKRLVSAGADVDHKDNDGDTAMLCNAASGNTRALRALLIAGADPHQTNQRGESCLQLAARYCVTDMMRLLIDEGADVGANSLSSEPPLLEACKVHYKRYAGLKLLLENRADPNCVDNRGRTPLHIVCWQYSPGEGRNENSDRLRSIEILIKHGADVNATYLEQMRDRSFNVSVIGVAAGHFSVRVGAMKALLAAGASPHGLDKEGNPVIVTACKYSPQIDGTTKEPDMVQVLLDAGADLHYQDEMHRSLLHYTSLPDSSNFLAIKTLMNKGLDVNAKDIYGRTPLHYACQNKYWMTTDANRTWEAGGGYSHSDSEYASWHCLAESTLTIHQLLAHEADTTASDQFECTPAHVAAKAGNPRVMATLLLQAGSYQVYDFPDKCKRLPFHYAVLSAETVRLLLHYHSTGEINTDRYRSVEEQRKESLAILVHRITNKTGHDLSRNRYQKSHPNETIDEESFPLPWRRGLCNAQDSYGNTPLHYAALAGSLDVVKRYIATPDVDPSIRNSDDETPFDFSLKNHDCAIVLRNRFLELGIEVSENGDGPVRSRSRSRRAADRFVKALGQSVRYGVYPLDA